MTMFPKPKRYRDKAYLEFVRMHYCCLCGAHGPNMAHHCSFVAGTGQGTKPSDKFVVPLCFSHHNLVHKDPSLYKYPLALSIIRLRSEWEDRE